MNTNLFKKFIISLFIAFLFLFLPTRLQAAMTNAEINKELAAISFLLRGLSQDLQLGRVPLASIKAELDKLSIFVANFIILAQSNSTDPLPGQVLGDFTEAPNQQKPYLPEAFIAINPGSGRATSITTGGSARTVLNFDIKAFYSDVEVRRIDVVFDKRMWLFAEEISLVSGGRTLSKIVQPTSSSFFDVGSGHYALRFTDFSDKISKDRSKTFSVKLKAKEFIPEEVDVRVFLNNNSIRIIDQTNIQHSVPSTTGGIGGSFSREFRVKRD